MTQLDVVVRPTDETLAFGVDEGYNSACARAPLGAGDRHRETVCGALYGLETLSQLV